jgi:hypothetical protein
MSLALGYKPSESKYEAKSREQMTQRTKHVSEVKEAKSIQRRSNLKSPMKDSKMQTIDNTDL